MSEESDKILFALEILLVRRKTCDSCWHNRTGHCSLYSSNCATAVFNQAADPPRWTSYEDGEGQEASVLNIKGGA